MRSSRAVVALSLWQLAAAGELQKILAYISNPETHTAATFDPLSPSAHEMHIEVGVYFEMLHKVDDVGHTFDAASVSLDTSAEYGVESKQLFSINVK